MQILHGPPGKVHSLAFAPDRPTLAAAAGRSPVVWLWDTVAGRLAHELTVPRRVGSLTFLPALPHALVVTDTVSAIFCPTDGSHPADPLSLRARPDGEYTVPLRLAFSPDGRWLACNVSSPGRRSNFEPTLWDLPRRRPVAHLRPSASCLAFSPDSRWLATGNFARSHDVIVWEVEPLGSAAVLTHGKKVHHVAFSPDGSRLAAASPEGLVKLWRTDTWRHAATLRGAGRLLRAIAFAPDGGVLAAASGDGSVRFWDTATGRPRGAFDWRIGAVHSVAFAPDGLRAAAGGDGRIAVWDVDAWGA